jgi:hypothetical protein
VAVLHALNLAARHADPFALLGPHAAPGGVVLRAFVPGAESLSAIIADAVPLSQNAAAEAALAYCREHPRTCVDIARKAEGIPSTLAKGAKP